MSTGKAEYPIEKPLQHNEESRRTGRILESAPAGTFVRQVIILPTHNFELVSRVDVWYISLEPLITTSF